jgi:hypothetical protein
MNTSPVVESVKPAISPENLIHFEVMGTSGHVEHKWDKTKTVEVDAARTLFNKLISERYTAYKMNPKDNSKGDQVKEFDPEAGAYVFHPALAGG